jgi:hypothetical protein
LGLLDFDTEGIFGRRGDRALAHFLLSFRPGGFLNRLLGANDTGRVFAPGNSLGDLLGDSLGCFPRSTPGEFSLGDSIGSRAHSVSRNFLIGSKARSIETGGRAAQQGPQCKFLGGFCCLRA